MTLPGLYDSLEPFTLSIKQMVTSYHFRVHYINLAKVYIELCSHDDIARKVRKQWLVLLVKRWPVEMLKREGNKKCQKCLVSSRKAKKKKNLMSCRLQLSDSYPSAFGLRVSITNSPIWNSFLSSNISFIGSSHEGNHHCRHCYFDSCQSALEL